MFDFSIVSVGDQVGEGIGGGRLGEVSKAKHVIPNTSPSSYPSLYDDDKP
jgi:hypothetical protein